jgi:hypothetical protein
MRRKLSVDETNLVRETHEREGDDGVILLLMELMGPKADGDYHVAGHVEYEDNGEAWAELDVRRPPLDS